MECNRDEAIKAKVIAERKFNEKDVVSAKRFACKAKNLFPSLEGIDQMIATLDAYLAAEVKINGESDWYQVLQVDDSADERTLKKQYKKLAHQLHPDKNKFAGAEGAFKLITEAWNLFSDKSRKMKYDERRNMSSNPSGLDTFWTICNLCRMQYKFRRICCNRKLLCPNCHRPFLAKEKVVQNLDEASSYPPSKQQKEDLPRDSINNGLSNCTSLQNRPREVQQKEKPEQCNDRNLQYAHDTNTGSAPTVKNASAKAVHQIHPQYKGTTRKHRHGQVEATKDKNCRNDNDASKRHLGGSDNLISGKNDNDHEHKELLSSIKKVAKRKLSSRDDCDVEAEGDETEKVAINTEEETSEQKDFSWEFSQIKSEKSVAGKFKSQSCSKLDNINITHVTILEGKDKSNQYQNQKEADIEQASVEYDENGGKQAYQNCHRNKESLYGDNIMLDKQTSKPVPNIITDHEVHDFNKVQPLASEAPVIASNIAMTETQPDGDQDVDLRAKNTPEESLLTEGQTCMSNSQAAPLAVLAPQVTTDLKKKQKIATQGRRILTSAGSSNNLTAQIKLRGAISMLEDAVVWHMESGEYIASLLGELRSAAIMLGPDIVAVVEPLAVAASKLAENLSATKVQESETHASLVNEVSAYANEITELERTQEVLDQVKKFIGVRLGFCCDRLKSTRETLIVMDDVSRNLTHKLREDDRQRTKETIFGVMKTLFGREIH